MGVGMIVSLHSVKKLRTWISSAFDREHIKNVTLETEFCRELHQKVEPAYPVASDLSASPLPGAISCNSLGSPLSIARRTFSIRLSRLSKFPGSMGS